ncbi:MAG: AAA family ATPase, partial [Ilumatobacter sp.]|nr:AAA family ATPase [Ilumatobacter sp.]
MSRSHPTSLPIVDGFTVEEQIGSGGFSRVYRANQHGLERPVAIKVLNATFEDERQRRTFERECRVMGQLSTHPNIVTVFASALTADEHPCIVMELYAGTYRGMSNLSIAQVVDVGAKVADALAAVHDRGIVHRDIKPGNVLVDADGVAKIVDLGLAKVTNDRSEPGLTHIAETLGTPAYMGPELLGAGGSADIRSDLYALGVTFYELLAGQRPFRSSDPVELVHAHIARVPPPLSEVAPHVPQPLSAIVARLMAKVADARYQSARGLRLDLERCRDAWRRDEALPPITPGERDFSETLRIPERLYGREQAIAGLLSAFARARQGASELLLVAGPSGVGKSAVIREVHRPITLQRGHFIAGKCDQFNRDLPYAPLLQAIAELCRHLLSEPEESLQRWRANLLEGLGPNGQLIIDAVPSAQLVLGPQPPVLEVPPDESANRFRSVFRDLLRAVSRQRPLVIFLDDLQWCDLATLQLISFVLVDPQSANLLWLGAFRDHEVGDDHPLTHMQRALAEDDVVVRRIQLGPLTLADTTALVRESLTPSARDPEPLAATLQARTEGNPFFLVELLRTMAGEAQDLRAIAKARLPERSVALQRLAQEQLRRVPPTSRPLLEMAAVAGRDVDLDLLETLAPTSDLKGWVGACTRASLFEVREGSLRFAHDKVREGILAHLGLERRTSIHRRIAETLEARGTAESRYLPALVHHWSVAGEAAKERDYAARAGRWALESGACHEAVVFLSRALELVEPVEGEDTLKAPTTPTSREDLQALLTEANFQLGRLDEVRRHGVQALVALGHPMPTSTFGLALGMFGQLTIRVLQSLLPSMVGRIGPAARAHAVDAMRVQERLMELFIYAEQPLQIMWAGLKLLNLG